ncbi:site-specific DNA-methyltransferase [Spirochaetota bacterium]
MPSTEQLRSRLLKKLSELFQLDQPDLDFGFYRIMHAKAKEVQDFIGTDLLKIVADAFGDVDEARKAERQAAYEKAIEQAKKYGAPVPEETDAAKEAKAALDAVKDTASAEADVYDHLYRFFERYYDDGDFISRRYYTRETSGKAAPFAVPYNGEEVKLHWANADQYYIKSAEYFSNFTFDLTQSAEIRRMSKEERELNQIPESPCKVHFRVVEATEGEHGNVKASEVNKRFFILHTENPVAVIETGELVVNFEYRPDPEKTGQENTWRDKRNVEAVETILEHLQAMAAAGGEHEKQVAEYLRLLKIPAPTDSDKKRPVLAKYVNQYTARNTMDYFIHKDLGGFLHRELDFYIKNEVMLLDDFVPERLDLSDAELEIHARANKDILKKVATLRKIASKLIDFLAQLEDFQKKLWLKKKFIIETNYCITLDRVPEELFAEVAACDAQCEEWIKLFAIDEIQADGHSPTFSRPLTVEFFKANNKLVLDTHFFDDSFKARLVASIENFDEQCDGLLIHSENFQALNLLQERYKGGVRCAHIDPPYNTATSGFLYKNTYEHSSWLSMMNDRIALASFLLDNQGEFICHIDENEYERLNILFNNHGLNASGTVIWDKKNPMLGRKGIATQHEYVIWLSKYDRSVVGRSESIVSMQECVKSLVEKHGAVTEHVREEYRKWLGKQENLSGGEKAYKLIDDNGDIYRLVAMGAPEKRTDPKFHIPLKHPATGKNCPVPPNGWSRTPETLADLIKDKMIVFGTDETTQPQKKVYLRDDAQKQITSVYSDGKSGKAYLEPMGLEFPYCHPVSMYEHLLSVAQGDATFIDFFAGSGTNGHAVLNLIRTTKQRHKSILVEMGSHFDTVLKPRISKVVYSESWKDGKPTARHTGVSHCFKYIRLESYEDTLNNLRLDHNTRRKKAVAANPAFKEDYMLRYLLDVETRGSQSLLNIDAFADPTVYTLDVKKPGTDEYATRAVDLVETFNYLIGLRVLHTSVPQTFQATFKRIMDPELPEDQHTKLVVNGRIRQDEGGLWWFRKVEGWVPKDAASPDNGQREKVLVVWRKLTEDIEQDNLLLDEWFQKNRISTRDFEFDTIYVNGSNNLPNLKLDDENWKVRLIEEEFMKRMWNGENA